MYILCRAEVKEGGEQKVSVLDGEVVARADQQADQQHAGGHGGQMMNLRRNQMRHTFLGPHREEVRIIENLTDLRNTISHIIHF